MKWKSTKNHWTKIKTGKEKEDILKKVSKGWNNLIFQKKDRKKNNTKEQLEQFLLG